MFSREPLASARPALARGSWLNAPEMSFVLSANLVFAQQLAETRIAADRIEIGVLAHVAEVAVAQLDRAPQRLEGLVGPLQPGVTTGEVVVSEGIVGTQLDQAPVDLQALGVA